MNRPIEIELKHLAAYLPYGLNVSVLTHEDKNKQPLVGKLCELTYKSNHGNWAKVHFDDCHNVTYQTWEQRFSNFHTYFIKQDIIKPILRSLSDLFNAECHSSKTYNYALEEETGLKLDWDLEICGECFYLPGFLQLLEFLYKHHFDVFGLIDAGLAIDINTLEL